MPFAKTETYTTDYIYALPEEQRAELIDGVVFDMAPPNRIHQENQYIFDDDIPICIYDGLVINISKLLK